MTEEQDLKCKTCTWKKDLNDKGEEWCTRNPKLVKCELIRLRGCRYHSEYVPPVS